MTDKKFTDFPAVATPLTSDLIWAVQAGADVKETLGQVLSLALSTNSLSYAGNPNGNLAGTIYQTCYDTTNAKYYICTTTGSASTAVWTLIGANIVGLNQGGTNKALTASNGGIVYSDADSLEILSGNATASKMVLSGASSAPTWSTSTIPSSAGATANKVLLSDGTNYVLSTPTFPNASAATGSITISNGTNWIASTSLWPNTVGTAGKILRSDGTNNLYTTATYPNTTTINQILYSSSADVIAGLATANSAQIVTSSTGVPAMTASMTNGQIVIGSTGATPVPAIITGVGITVTNGAGSITLTSAGGGMAWTDVTGTSQAISVDNGYVANNVGLVTLTLPVTAVFGSVVEIRGLGAGGWRIAQNASQIIHLGSSATSTGVGGRLDSTNRYDCLSLTCVVANLEFVCNAVQGIITVT